MAEQGAESDEEGLDVADHLAGRFQVDQGPLPVQSTHLFLDFEWRFVDEDLLTIAIRYDLELLALVGTPGHKTVHEVGRVHRVVGRECNHEAMVESARALHEGILLLL